MTRRKRNDQIALQHRQAARRHDQPVIRAACKGRDGALDLVGVAHIHRDHLQPDRGSHCVDCAPLADPGRYGGIPNDSYSLHARSDLLEQLQPFPTHAVFETW